MKGRVLTIAGSDSGGGAGIQADIKTITALGGYAMSAITAVTVQNTRGVSAVHPVSAETVAAQISATLSDIGADAIKTGMLVDAATIEAVATALRGASSIPRVIDPVMAAAKDGRPLLANDAVAALRALLMKGAAVVTPNVPEAEILTGRRIASEDDMAAAADDLRALGAEWVLLKGGHLAGATVVDLLIGRERIVRYADARLGTQPRHGTGCTLASAIAVGLAQGLAIDEAVACARSYVRTAIATAPALGHGNGPLNHGHTMCDVD